MSDARGPDAGEGSGRGRGAGDAVSLAISGATGRMGRELLAVAGERDDVVVAIATTRTPEEGPVAGVELADADDLPALLADRDVDVLVDFTVPEPSVAAVEAAADAGVAAVIGTTGFDSSETAALRDASESIPVLKAANFARGIQALLQVVGEAAAAMEGYDAELIETHHNGKRDAPSGTAKRILREIEGGRERAEAHRQRGEAHREGSEARREGGDVDRERSDGGSTGSGGDPNRVHGREGHAPREDGEIGVHAVRAGDVTGIHEVLLAGNHEELRLTHRAEDRGVFAAGALDAAVWLAGREAGWYDFADVLGGS